MTTKLSGVVVKEVSLVPKGANAKKIHLRKSDEETAAHEGTTKMDELEKAQKEAADAQAALEKAAADQKALADKVAELEKAQKDAADKAASEKAALEKAAAEAATKAAELEKALAIEKEAKEVAESIKKAAEDFKNLPEKAEELGPLLREVRKAAPEAADKLESLLKRVDAVAKGALEPKGVSQGGDVTATALDEIQKRAKALVVEKKAKTEAEAFDLVLKADPSLYTKYQNEQRSGR